MPVPEIATHRLLLRAWRDEDVAPYAAINADPQVRRWLYPPRPLDADEAAREIEVERRRWERLGFGHWAVELRESGALIGRAGAKRHADWPLDPLNTEIGWCLARAAWGRGYASEAAAEAARHCLATVGVPEVISIAHHENRASQRVMERTGMQRAGARRWAERDLDVVFYRLGAAEHPLAVVRRMWMIYRERGVAAALAELAADVRFVAHDGTAFDGHAGVRAFFAGFRERGEDFAASPFTFEPRGDGVLVAGHRRVKGRAGSRGEHLWFAHRVRRGRIAWVAAFTDRERALEALGAPPPGGGRRDG